MDALPKHTSYSHTSDPPMSPLTADPCPPPPPPAASTSNANTKKTEYLSQPKVLLVADSIGSNIQIESSREVHEHSYQVCKGLQFS